MPLRDWLREHLPGLRRRTPRPAHSSVSSMSAPRAHRRLADPRLTSWNPRWGACGTPVEVHPGLFEVPLLTPEAAGWVRAELAAARSHALATGHWPAPPNSMHQAGAEVADLGLSTWAEGLAVEVLAPLAHRLFPEHAPRPPPAVHAFSVDYGPLGDTALAQHVDDAQVTVNLWLGGDAAGSAVVFEGVRCLSHLDVPETPPEVFAWRGRPGVALVHVGLHRHRTEAVGPGQRDSLIFWLQDPEVREAHFDAAHGGRCPPWCGAPSADGRTWREV